MPLKIHFVTKATNKLASFRMRIQVPSRLLNYCFDGAVVCTSGNIADTAADVNVFSKHFDQDQILQQIAAKEDFGYKAVFDVCDDHFDRPDGKFYEKMVERADLITCNSANMQERIYEVTGKLARIITDPVSFPTAEPKLHEAGVKPKVMWFGHNSNLGPLIKVAELNTTPIIAYCEKLFKGLKNIRMLKWNLGEVERAIQDYDVIVIPTQTYKWAKCKSPNRAVDAITSGKFVITDSMDVYSELKDYLMIVPDLCTREGALNEALTWWSDNPQKAHDMIVKGQQFIATTYTSDTIINAWIKVLEELGLIGKEHARSA